MKPAPSRQIPKVPQYCRHRRSGTAYVNILRQQVQLGQYGTDESLAAYQRAITRLRAAGPIAVIKEGGREINCMEIVGAFTEWAAKRYTRCPQQVDVFGVPCKRLLRLHAKTGVGNFGPVALKEVRSAMIADGLTRRAINGYIHRVRQIWRWAVENELIDESAWRRLLSVRALAEGEESVREAEPVEPGRWRQIRVVLRNCPRPVRQMVRLQILTGMRPGEVVQMRTCDVDRSADVWVYQPAEHKTKARGKLRPVLLGPRAQQLLRPLLDEASPMRYLFRPADAMEEARLRQVAASPAVRWPSHDPARRRDRRRSRGAPAREEMLQERYTTAAYRRAVQRACELAWPLPERLRRHKGEKGSAWRTRIGADGVAAVSAWRHEHLLRPHQLRHSFATRVGNRFEEQDAQRLLGHSKIATTRLYIKTHVRRGRRIIQEVG